MSHPLNSVFETHATTDYTFALHSLEAGGICATTRGEATDIFFVDPFSLNQHSQAQFWSQMKISEDIKNGNPKNYGYKVLHLDVTTRNMSTVMSNVPEDPSSKIFLDVAAFTLSNTSVKLFTLQAQCTELLAEYNNQNPKKCVLHDIWDYRKDYRPYAKGYIGLYQKFTAENKTFAFELSFSDLVLHNGGWTPGESSAAVAVSSRALPSIAADKNGVFVLTTEKLSQFTCSSATCTETQSWLSGDSRLKTMKVIKDMHTMMLKGGQMVLEKNLTTGVAVRAFVSTVGGQLLSINAKDPDAAAVVRISVLMSPNCGLIPCLAGVA